MIKLRLLSAASVIAMGAAFAAPAQAFDDVHWSWNHNSYTDIDAYFDINTDFDPWGLTQVERLQVMAGNMTAFADGSGATYSVGGEYGSAAPIIIYNTFKPDQDASQNVINAGGGGGMPDITVFGNGSNHILSDQGPGDNEVEIKDNVLTLDLGSDVVNKNYGKNIAFQIFDFGDYSPHYTPALDALTQLASVEIAATAISNIATVDGEHMAMVHDGQIAFGKFNPADGYSDEEAAASIALSNWIGWDSNSYWTANDDTYGSSGNRNFDMAMLAWTSAQYGLIGKGYNSAYALGDYVSNAQLDVSATAAANIHTVSVTPLNEPEAEYGYSWGHSYPTGNITTENIAMVDLNQFGYQDTFAYASATDHMVSGYKNLGKLEGPVLKVSASALGNVSSVTNKFGGTAD